MRIEGATAAEDHGTGHVIFKFTHVAGPVVRHQDRFDGSRPFGCLNLVDVGMAFEEVAGQVDDVAFSLS